MFPRCKSNSIVDEEVFCHFNLFGKFVVTDPFDNWRLQIEILIVKVAQTKRNV